MKGRLILDCSILLPGPLLGKRCVEQGARVIKVENPSRPDPAKEMGSGATYRELNAQKELIELDISSSKDRPKFEALVAKADALIEGYRPSTKAKLGLETEQLLAINPDLVIASIVGFPEESPRKDSPGHDLSFLATTGVLSHFGSLPGLPLSDTLIAYEGAVALAARLDAQARGQSSGGRLTISVVDVLMKFQANAVAEYRATEIEPHYGSTFVTGATPCYQMYRAKCGRQIAVAAMEAKYWNAFCETLGLPHLKDKGLTTGQDAHAVALEVQAKLGSKNWSDWEAAITQADCCVEAVRSYSELFGQQKV